MSQCEPISAISQAINANQRRARGAHVGKKRNTAPTIRAQHGASSREQPCTGADLRDNGGGFDTLAWEFGRGPCGVGLLDV